MINPQINEDGTWSCSDGDVISGCTLHLADLENENLEIRTLKQVHGNRVYDDQDYTKESLEGDGLVTQESGKALVIRTADCVPIHIYDDNAVAVLHSGWRSTRAGIAEKVVSCFDLEKARVILGPAIEPARYEVDADLYEDWLAEDRRLEPFLLPAPVGGSKRLLNLRGFIRVQLQDLGFRPEAIFQIPVCTYDSALPSYRRQGAAAARIFNYSYRRRA